MRASKGETSLNMSKAKRRRVRDEVLAGAAAADGGRGPLGVGAGARAHKVVVHDDLTEKEKEYVKWHMDNREAKLRAKGKLDDLAPGPGDAPVQRTIQRRPSFTVKRRSITRVNPGSPPLRARSERVMDRATPRTSAFTRTTVTRRAYRRLNFPEHGALAPLKRGMDNTVKIWDVYNTHKCMRTYMGHDKAVKDVNFNSDGTRFVSTSWDKKVRLWDKKPENHSNRNGPEKWDTAPSFILSKIISC